MTSHQKTILFLGVVATLLACSTGENGDDGEVDPSRWSIYLLENNSNYELTAQVVVQGYSLPFITTVEVGETKEVAAYAEIGNPHPLSDPPSHHITDFTLSAVIGSAETVVYSGISDDDWVIADVYTTDTAPYLLAIDESDFSF